MRGRVPVRQMEILRLLGKHGVLSLQDLIQMNPKPLDRKSMSKSCRILVQKGLVRALSKNIGGSPVNYFMLCGARSRPKELNHFLRKDVLPSARPGLRFTHYGHESLCARVHESLERSLTGATIIRDFQCKHADVPFEIIPESMLQSGSLPDICVRIACKNGSEDWYAVEIERTHKAERRLEKRIEAYAMECGFKGVLFFMANSSMTHKLHCLFSERIAPKALRVRGFLDRFLATALLPQSVFDANVMQVRTQRGFTSVARWLEQSASGHRPTVGP